MKKYQIRKFILCCVGLSVCAIYALHYSNSSTNAMADSGGTSASPIPFSEFTTVSDGNESMWHASSIPFSEFTTVWDGNDKKGAEAQIKSAELRSPKLDLDGQSRLAWPNDAQCKQYNISFAKDMTRAFLVSYPRSGNSWTRYMIEGASGIFTGSKYKSSMLSRMGFLGEKISFKQKRTIINKIHNHSRKKVPDYSPVVLLIRNPARSIVSFWSYSHQKRGKKRIHYNISGESYKSTSFSKFTINGFRKWSEIAKSRLTFSRRLLVVPYEYLTADPIAYIRRILQFLGVPANEGRLSCLSKHLEGPVLGLQREIDPFTKPQKQLMAKYVNEIQDLLKQRGMDPLPPYPEMQ